MWGCGGDVCWRMDVMGVCGELSECEGRWVCRKENNKFPARDIFFTELGKQQVLGF